MKKRRIGFFNLYCIEGENTLSIIDNLTKTLRFIANQTNKLKKKDLSDDRICFLDSYNYDEEQGLIKILFKSARHSYRAPLLNRNTIEARENPKTKDSKLWVFRSSRLFNAIYFYYLYFKDVMHHKGYIVTLHNIKYTQML